MDTYYIASLEENSGKTLVAAALGQRLAAQGKRVGYLKPVGAPDDPDPATMRHALGASEDDISRPLAPIRTSGQAFTADHQKLLAALEIARRKRNVLLVEGPRGPFNASAVARDVADMQGARIILIAWYREDLSAGEIAEKMTDLKGSLASVLLNGVPPLRMHHVQSSILPQLAAAGVRVLGALPQDRSLRAATIREIADAVQGEIVSFPERADTLVEHVMIGALVLDNGKYYFSQFKNKLVVTRWDRPDLQNAAIETDTVGFLLTGGQGPIPYMQNRVQEKKLPVIVVQEGTIALASRIDAAFSRGKLHPRKIQRAAELLEQYAHIDGLAGVHAS